MTKITYVTVHPLVTTIGWDDNTTTVVKSGKNDIFDMEKGVLWAIAKKFLPTSDILRAFEMSKESLNVFSKNQKELEKNKS